MLALLTLAATAWSRPATSGLGSTLLRLRGGQVDAPVTNALSREQITEKLNSVPVFCIVNEKGGLVGTRGKDGKESVCWFTDATESKALLKLMREHNPDVTLNLGVYGLGTVFKICGGWADEESPEMQSESSERFTGDLRLQGNMPLMKETSPRLLEMLKEAGIEAGNWQLPVFICEQLQTSAILPVFFTPADLAATWEKSGRTKEEMPDEIAMMDIRILVSQMQTDSNPWRVIQFVSSPEAYELVRELQGDRVDTQSSAEEEEADELYSS